MSSWATGRPPRACGGPERGASLRADRAEPCLGDAPPRRRGPTARPIELPALGTPITDHGGPSSASWSLPSTMPGRDLWAHLRAPLMQALLSAGGPDPEHPFGRRPRQPRCRDPRHRACRHPVTCLPRGATAGWCGTTPGSRPRHRFSLRSPPTSVESATRARVLRPSPTSVAKNVDIGVCSDACRTRRAVPDRC